MKNASISVQVLPLGKNQKTSLKIIDKVISLIKKSGVNSEVGPLETVMEGDLEKLLEILKEIQLLLLKENGIFFSNIKIISDKKGVLTIGQKVKKHR